MGKITFLRDVVNPPEEVDKLEGEWKRMQVQKIFIDHGTLWTEPYVLYIINIK